MNKMKFNWFYVNLLAFIYLYCAFVFEVLWVHLLVQEWSAFPDWGNYQAVCKDRSDGGLGPLWHTPELHIWGPVLHWRTWRHDRSSRMVWSKTGSQKYVWYSYVVNFAYNMCLDFSTRTLNMVLIMYICPMSLTDEAWVGVYTLKDCYPVQETYTKNSSVTTSTRFFDLQLGISDPGVFNPPSTCQSALSEKMTSDCWIPRSSLLITVHITHNTVTASK